MEVVCSSCGTEYDFDEARVPEGGVTVKCTTCGHVFKVSKNDDGAAIQETSTPPSKTGNWQIKKENGDQLSFKALSTLQKWIVERKVGGSDQISRTGDKWTRLADVPEFQVFFQAIGPAPSPAQEEAPEDPKAPEAPKKKTKKKRMLAKKASKKKKKKTSKKASDKQKDVTLESFMEGGGVPADTTQDQNNSATIKEDSKSSPGESASDPFLDDDDPIKKWQEQKAKRNTMIGIGISSFMALLFLASIVNVLLTPSAPKKKKAPPPQAAMSQPDMLVRTLPDVLSSDNIQEINALLTEIDTALTNTAMDKGNQSLLYSAKGRLYLSMARMEKELAHLHYLHAKSLERMRPQAAQVAMDSQKSALKKAEAFFAKAKIAVAASGEALPDHPLVLLAKADKNAYESGMDLMRLNIQKARNVGLAYKLDAMVHYEAKVIVMLGDALNSMLKSDLSLVKDALSSLHLLLNSKWYEDKRIVYLSLILGITENKLRTFPDFGRIDRIKEGLDIFINDNPNHQRARILKKIAPDILPQKDARANHVSNKVEKAVDKLRSLRLRGRQKKAIKKLKALARKHSKEPAPLVELGWANMDINKPEKAMRYFDEAIRLSPTDPMANYGRAEALRLSGKPHQALEAYDKFLSISPRGPEAEAARNTIDTLIEILEMAQRNRKYRLNKMQKN